MTTMNLTFTGSQFFQVFADYNQSVWPAQYVLLVMVIAVAACVARAPAFAVLSLAAAAAFAWQGFFRRRLQFEAGWTLRKIIGLVFIAVALVGYPLAGGMLGHRYPAAPTFGLPCPTTIYTFGVLLMATPAPSRLQVIAPLLWALVGTTAAFALGVVQDLALIGAVAAGLWLLAVHRPFNH